MNGKKPNPVRDQEKTVRALDTRAFDGKVERLTKLAGQGGDRMIPFDHLVFEYYSEARLCYYVGAFVASVVMTQMALEELLRSRYRVIRGVDGSLSSGKKIDEAGFNDLTREAKVDGFLSLEETMAFDRLRKNRRNLYVHPKDVKSRSRDPRSFFEVALRISAPEIALGSAEEDAADSMMLLNDLVPKLSLRKWGLQTE